MNIASQRVKLVPRDQPPGIDIDKVIGANGKARGEQVLGVPLKKERWSRTVEITPAKAQMLLLTAPPLQRPLKQTKVEAFAALIKAGQFATTHQGIAFNTRGELIDGQHRLQGCVVADLSIFIDATFNEPDQNFVYYDRGSRRTVADDLVIWGSTTPGPHGTALVAAARILHHFDNGRPPWHGRSEDREFLASDALTASHQHPKLADTVAWSIGNLRGRYKPPMGPFAAMLTLFREVDEEMAMSFAEQIATGEGLKSGDPALALREGMMRGVQRSTFTQRASFCSKMIFAWNALYEGRQLSMVRGLLSRKDPLPKISGYKPKD